MFLIRYDNHKEGQQAHHTHARNNTSVAKVLTDPARKQASNNHTSRTQDLIEAINAPPFFRRYVRLYRGHSYIKGVDG